MEHFSTDNMAMFTPFEEYKAIPGFDPIKALTATYRKSDNVEPATPANQIIDDPKDVEELDAFCRKHGIIGAGFGCMGAKNALRMLKGRMGIRENKTTRGLLNG